MHVSAIIHIFIDGNLSSDKKEISVSAQFYTPTFDKQAL